MKEVIEKLIQLIATLNDDTVDLYAEIDDCGFYAIIDGTPYSVSVVERTMDNIVKRMYNTDEGGF